MEMTQMPRFTYEIELSNVPDGCYTSWYLGTDEREYETREEAEQAVREFYAAKESRPEDFEPDMEATIVENIEALHKITLEPEEPECKSKDGHEWVSPLAIVGGCKENPGVYGSGGGVTISEACLHCGCKKLTDTWAQDPEDGEQGLESTSYYPREYEDHVQELLESKIEWAVRESGEQGYAMIRGALDYRGLSATIDLVIETESSHTENESDWPGPGDWPNPPQELIDEARALIEPEEEDDADPEVA
jgi:hypothetical protein